MRKSIIFLLCSLVVLLPLGTNMNIILNANATTENEYYTDQYMRYVDDMVNEYEDESSYANDDGYDGSEQDRTYENNNYDREYPSYKQYYEPEYKVYENEKDKSKDRDSSVSIKEIKCINTNINTNGDVNIFLGFPGLTAANAEDALTDSVLGNGERYNEGYKKGKNIICDINNNNNNTIVNVNATASDDNLIDTCEECFTENLSFEQEEILAEVLALNTDINNLEGLCDFLADESIPRENRLAFLSLIFSELSNLDIPSDNLRDIRNCLIGLGLLN